MASLFTPESAKLAASQKARAASAPPGQNGMKIPGMGKIKGKKTGDSLGNPQSPGYEAWGKRKEEEAKNAGEPAQGPAGTVVETTSQGPEIVRLSAGWEKLLVAQKKLCDKARAIFTRLDGPPRYNSQKKNRLPKTAGCILDLDLQATEDEKRAERERQKEREKEREKESA